MRSEEPIEVRGVTKTYRVGVGRARVREMLPPPVDRLVGGLFPRWWSKDTFDALKDVSVSVPAGSTLGIVGPNGAGKTTLLKVIAGVTSPSAGDVRVGGRIAALIDLLVGFHPELTGRENIYLLGSMHGFGRRELRGRIERILDFAEIGELADTPLKRYSAGMGARLGFATITALDVDILLVDEVLAVGDAAFQRKCIGWLDDFRERGGTLIFVSHNLGLVRNMTDRAVWLDHGRVVADGPTRDVLSSYARGMDERRDERMVFHRREARKLMSARGLHRWGAGGARVRGVRVADPSADAEVDLVISYEADGLDRAVFCVGFTDDQGHELGAAASTPIGLNGGRGEVRCTISPLPLRAGIYFPVVAILSTDGQIRDRWRLDRAIVVDRDAEVDLADAFGPLEVPASWREGSG